MRCKGSWVLGTACGTCKHCRDEAVAIVPALVNDRNKLRRVLALTPNKPEGSGDISEGLQAALWREIRMTLHDN